MQRNCIFPGRYAPLMSGFEDSLVRRPLFPQLRMDYITATWKEGLAHRSNFLVLTCFECYANYCIVISVVIV